MRLVFAGTDGDLYGWRQDEPLARRLTWSWDEVDVHGTRSRLCYSWPTCSPDGRRILTLARRDDRHFAYLVDVDGIAAEEVASFGRAVAIYGNWAPDGSRIAVLLQGSDTLSLEVVEIGGARHRRCVARGAPLFWSWAPDARTIAVHAGQSREDMSTGGTSLVDTDTAETRAILRGVPALFRSPAWSADGRFVAFARLGERGTRLVFLDPETEERQSRELPSGPVAFVWHPRLPALAYATATDATPHLYERVVMLDLREQREWVIARPTLAFYWHPERFALFRLTIDRQREELAWETAVGDDEQRVLARFLPTRETVFAASFFDQYARSHLPVAPDGSAIAVAGRLAEDRSDGAPRVYLVPVEEDAPSRMVGEGVYPVWSA